MHRRNPERENRRLDEHVSGAGGARVEDRRNCRGQNVQQRLLLLSLTHHENDNEQGVEQLHLWQPLVPLTSHLLLPTARREQHQGYHGVRKSDLEREHVEQHILVPTAAQWKSWVQPASRNQERPGACNKPVGHRKAGASCDFKGCSLPMRCCKNLEPPGFRTNFHLVLG